MKTDVTQPAPKTRSVVARNVAWTYAAILVVMAVGQLFAFEKFIPALDEYGLPGGSAAATLLASVIVVCEIFALPFLLRMSLSPLMRQVSAVASAVIPLIWGALSVLLIFAIAPPEGSAHGVMFGTKVQIPGVIQFMLSLSLFAMAVYSLRGLRAFNAGDK